MKNATAISQGSRRLLVSVKEGGAPKVEGVDDVDDVESWAEETEADEGLGARSLPRSAEFEELESGGLEGIVLRDRVRFLQIF